MADQENLPAKTGGTSLDKIERQGLTAADQVRMHQIMVDRVRARFGKEGMGVGQLIGIARFCEHTGCSPEHLTNFEGKLYPEAEFWMDKAAQDDNYNNCEFIRVDDEGLKEALELAVELAAEAKEMKDIDTDGEMAREAIAAKKKVIEIRNLRREYAVSPDAIRAYVCRIFMKDRDPIEEYYGVGGQKRVAKDSRGQLIYPDKSDPIAMANPAKTARTRAFRRAARLAIPIAVKKVDDAYTKYESSMVIEEAEYEVMDEGGDKKSIRKAIANDREDARKKFFATMNDIARSRGIERLDRDKRVAWQKAHGLPESTKEWGYEQFVHAVDLLTRPIRDEITKLSGGKDISEVAIETIGRPADYARDLIAVRDKLIERRTEEI